MIKNIFYVTNPHVTDMHKIPSIMEDNGDTVKIFTSKRDLQQKLSDNEIPDIIICDRPTFLLTADQIRLVNNNCFNIHPALLPYNRGYHPNFWSFYEHTPSGATIHAIDENIDSGGILAQAEVVFPNTDTLRSSYYTLRELSISLFKITYPRLRNGYNQLTFKQNNVKQGSIKYKKDFDGLFAKLPMGWDTSIEYVSKMKGC